MCCDLFDHPKTCMGHSSLIVCISDPLHPIVHHLSKKALVIFMTAALLFGGCVVPKASKMVGRFAIKGRRLEPSVMLSSPSSNVFSLFSPLLQTNVWSRHKELSPFPISSKSLPTFVKPPKATFQLLHQIRLYDLEEICPARSISIFAPYSNELWMQRPACDKRLGSSRYL